MVSPAWRNLMIRGVVSQAKASVPHSQQPAQIAGQWRNPTDILSILLIIGGDVIQIALAQLCGGVHPDVLHGPDGAKSKRKYKISFAPITFSFGWVAYSFSSVLSAVGDRQLMPSITEEWFVINTKNGYKRPNRSWLLSRLLRDCDPKLGDTRFRVRVFKTLDEGNGSPQRDALWYSGLGVTFCQLILAAVPCILKQRNWTVLLITICGTLLAYIGGALPQWKTEKWSCRLGTSERKTVAMTKGNGSFFAVVIVDDKGRGLNLEDLASAEYAPHAWTLPVSALLATCWLVLLITVAGMKDDSWYLLGVGTIGMIHTYLVAGMHRSPGAFGLRIEEAMGVCAPRRPKHSQVMDTLTFLEEAFPYAGAALRPEFFPSFKNDEEKAVWDEFKKTAKARQAAWILKSKDEADVSRALIPDVALLGYTVGKAVPPTS